MAPDIPDEIWLHIFKYLTQLDLIKIMPVSKHFNALSHDPVFWKEEIPETWIKVINPTCLIKLPIRSASIEFSTMDYGYLALKLFPNLRKLNILGGLGHHALLSAVPNVKKLSIAICELNRKMGSPYFQPIRGGTFIDLEPIKTLNLTFLRIYNVIFEIHKNYKFKICDQVEKLGINDDMLDMNILQKFPNIKKLCVIGPKGNDETLSRAQKKIGQKPIKICSRLL